LRSVGIPGVHFGASEDNMASLAFFEKT